jgi:FAD/FMN-containing dehydrogenase
MGIVSHGKAGRLALVLALALSQGGCLAAAAAAGAGGAIAYNDRGAHSLVNGSVADVVADARAVFNDMGITLDTPGANEGENDRTVSGVRGDMRVSVEIERQSATTSEVMVTARKGAVDFDRELARDVLSRIMARR